MFVVKPSSSGFFQYFSLLSTRLHSTTLIRRLNHDNLAAMAESAKKPADDASLAPTQGKIQEMDITHQENAVGYREYIEAMGLEASDREVRRKLVLKLPRLLKR